MHPLQCKVKGGRNQVPCLPLGIITEILQIFKMFEGKLDIFSRLWDKSYRCSKVFLKNIGEKMQKSFRLSKKIWVFWRTLETKHIEVFKDFERNPWDVQLFFEGNSGKMKKSLKFSTILEGILEMFNCFFEDSEEKLKKSFRCSTCFEEHWKKSINPWHFEDFWRKLEQKQETGNDHAFFWRGQKNIF